MKSCRDITLLIEKSREEKLSLKERLQIKLHTRMCKLCRNYKIDSKFLDGLLKRMRPKVVKLTNQEKALLSKRVEARLHSS